MELLLSAAEWKGKAESSPEGGRNFPLSIEAEELMVSSSKLWPLAGGPIIHGGSSPSRTPSL